MKRLLFFIVVQVVVHAYAESAVPQKSHDRHGRELYHYQYANDGAKSDYPIMTSTGNFAREGERAVAQIQLMCEDKLINYLYHIPGYLECAPNPMTSFIGRGLNYLLLKIGVVAVVKAILAGLLLVKVPLFFLKMAFLKTFLFPVLIAPLLIHFFAGQQTTETKPENEDNLMESTAGMGRLMEDRLAARIWGNMKIFAESQQCAERVACIFGAHNKEFPAGVTFGR